MVYLYHFTDMKGAKSIFNNGCMIRMKGPDKWIELHLWNYDNESKKCQHVSCDEAVKILNPETSADYRVYFRFESQRMVQLQYKEKNTSMTNIFICNCFLSDLVLYHLINRHHVSPPMTPLECLINLVMY
ncbi:hypothetical protein CHUAL_011551 [Chamberlinius hualienensis]